MYVGCWYSRLLLLKLARSEHLHAHLVQSIFARFIRFQHNRSGCVYMESSSNETKGTRFNRLCDSQCSVCPNVNIYMRTDKASSYGEARLYSRKSRWIKFNYCVARVDGHCCCGDGHCWFLLDKCVLLCFGRGGKPRQGGTIYGLTMKHVVE